MPTLEATTPQLKVVKDLIDAFVSLDMNNIVPYFTTKPYTVQSFPKAAELSSKAENEGGAEKFAALLSLFKKVEFTHHEIIEAPGKVILHSSIVAQTTGGEFDYDFIGIFTLAERDGELRVVDLKDFCDPVKRGNLFGWALTTLAVPKA